MVFTREFDDTTQVLLTRVDKACGQQYELIQAEIDKASLAGDKEFKLDLESIVWMEIAKAYGILFNRAIEEGWVKGILQEPLIEKVIN